LTAPRRSFATYCRDLPSSSGRIHISPERCWRKAKQRKRLRSRSKSLRPGFNEVVLTQGLFSAGPELMSGGERPRRKFLRVLTSSGVFSGHHASDCGLRNALSKSTYAIVFCRSQDGIDQSERTGKVALLVNGSDPIQAVLQQCIGVADCVLILENAYYSVISPEGCAAILWKDRAAAAKAAEALKITAKDLLELRLADEIVPEPLGGAHNDVPATAASLKHSLIRNLDELEKISAEERLKRRYDKFRSHGHYVEKKTAAAA